MKLIIYGEPFSKQSVRSRIATKKSTGKQYIHHYQTSKIKEGEYNIQLQIKSQLPKEFKMFTKGVIVNSLLFVFTPTKAVQKDVDSGKLVRKETKPDIPDNLMKGLFDAMEGIVYKNDSLVCELNKIKKIYGNVPRIEIDIEEIGEHMNFIEAINQIDEKHGIRVKDWVKNIYVCYTKQYLLTIYNGNNQTADGYKPTKNEILSNNWEVIELN